MICTILITTLSLEIEKNIFLSGVHRPCCGNINAITNPFRANMY